MAESDEGWNQPADLVGTVAAGRYKVVSRIGRGSTRDVYEAQHVSLGTHIALKVLHADEAESEAAARFLREGKTLGLFRHPNIVELIEVGRLDDGRLFLATELVRGVSLRELMERGILEQRRALGIMRQVLDAVGAAHAVGVIHRDIKPESIMIAEPGGLHGGDLVKMLDFGVAKLMADTATTLGENKLTKVGMTAFGSPRYIAPECVVGGEVDVRADLYSVGAVLFELLTGKPPFYDQDASKLMRLHAYAAVQTLAQRAPDKQFTPQLEFLVAEALVKAPEARFRSAAEMTSALDAAVHSLDVAAAQAAAAQAPPPATDKDAEQSTEAELGRPRHLAAPGSLVDNSFMLLAADYRPPPPAPAAAPEVKPVMDRTVRPPGMRIRTRNFVQRYWPRVRAFVQKHRLPVSAAAGTLLVVIIISFAVCSGGKKSDTVAHSGKASKKKATATETTKATGDLARRGQELLASGNAKQAAELLESELVKEPDNAAAYLILGHARFATGRRLDAVSAYERAVKLSAKLGRDADMRANATKILETRDIAAALVALELLASHVDPPADDTIVETATHNKTAEVRRRAFAIAEREGIAGKIDKVDSWALDLTQATSCEDRRAAVAKLASTNDKRAIPALKRVKVHKCVEKDATEAIAKLESDGS